MPRIRIIKRSWLPRLGAWLALSSVTIVAAEVSHCAVDQRLTALANILHTCTTLRHKEKVVLTQKRSFTYLFMSSWVHNINYSS